MISNRNTLIFRWFLLLLSVVFILSGAQPIKGNSKGNTFILKLNDNVEMSELFAKYPEFKKHLSQTDSKKVFSRNEPLKARAKKLEIKRRFGLMSTKQRKRLVAKLNNINADIARIEKNKAKAIQSGTYPNLDTTFRLNLKPTTKRDDLFKLLQRIPEVKYAKSSIEVTTQSLPNDKYVDPEQNNEWTSGTLSTGLSDLWGHENIDMKAMWNKTEPVTGNGIIVAVIDTGIDPFHEDISDNLWKNENDEYGYDFVNDDTFPIDGHGHGTHVAGTIAAEINNNLGIAGIAPGAEIMSLKALSDSGGGSDIWIAQAIEFAADNGADIINLSLGGFGHSNIMEDAVNYAHSLGVIIVAAAGNSADDADNYSPAKFENVITVASLSTDDTLSSFSNFGETIEVSAPGERIISLRAAGTSMGNPIDSNYTSSDGTSMAAPHVTGTLALIKKAYPDYTHDEITQTLLQSSTDLGETGKDTSFGYGKINAYNAIYNSSLVFGQITEPDTSELLVGDSATIIGSAYAQNFNSYSVSYKEEVDSTWTTIAKGLSEVRNNTLAEWDISSLETGKYTLKISINTSSETYDFYTSPYTRDTRVKEGFPKVLTSTDLRSHPVLYGTDEGVNMLAIATENLYSLNLTNLEETYTPVDNVSKYYSYIPLFRAAAIGDINQDGKDEIVIGGRGTITIIDNTNSSVEHDISSILGGVFYINKVILSDINQDSKLDIIFQAIGVGIYVLTENDGNLELLNGNWPYRNSSLGDPIAADLDANGTTEIIALDSAGNIIAINQNAELILNQSIGLSTESETLQDELFIGDIDNDGDLEIGASIINYSDAEIKFYLFHHTGALVSGWPSIHEGTYSSTQEAPVIADITGDSIPEVIAAQYAWDGTHLFILNQNGDLLNGSIRKISNQYAQDTALLIADVDNNSVNDIVLASSGDTAKISFFNHEGNNVIEDIEIQGISSSFYSRLALTINDIDNNDKLDIISIATNVIDNEAVITVHELDAPLQTSIQQRLTYRGNEQLTGLTKAPLTALEPITSLNGYLTSTSTVAFNWSLTGYTPEGINVTISKESAPWLALYENFHTEREVTITELELDPETTYIVSVQAKVGDEYSLIRTHLVRIDTSAPIMNTISIAYPSQHVIEVSIDATDDETGIQGFSYALGTESGLADIKDWRSAEGTSATLDVSSYVATTPDSDNPTIIYIQAVAINGANNAGTEPLSESINFTYLVPQALSLDSTSTYASDTNLQFIDWNHTQSLFEITQIHYGLGTSSETPNITGWRNAYADESRVALLNLDLTHGEQYYVFIKAENALGFTSIASSKRITIDTTPPITPILSTELSRISIETSTFSVTSIDDESDIKQHWIAIGSEIHLNDIIDWQAHSKNAVFDIGHVYETHLHNLPYFYIKVKSENKADLFSDSITYKVSTDTETPQVSNIQLNGNLINDGDEFQGFININFTATDNTSISAIEIRLYDKNNTLLSNITPQGSYGSVYLTRFTESIETDSGYTVQIQVSDNAGNTVYYTTPSFRFVNTDTEDVTPPLIHNISVNNKDILANDILKNSLNFNLDVEDDLSISTVTLILKDAQKSVISAIVAQKEGNSYVATFDESLFSDNQQYEIEIIATDISANEISSKFNFTFADIETFEVSNVLPYPNPFNPDLETSKIRFNLEGRSVVKLYVHSITGKRLYTYSSIHETGAQILEWDGRDDFGNNVSMGVYFAYLIVESMESSESVKKVLKLAVLK